MIPQQELDHFVLTFSLAADLADEGQVDDGYVCLMRGLRRADEALEDRHSWKRNLVRRWREAAESYARQYNPGCG